MTHELYKTKEEIKKWLQQYNIKNYELIKDSEYGYVVNVDSNVDLYSKKLKEIKIKFNIVDGDFNCAWNDLISLKGSPNIVSGFVSFTKNKLKTLKYCPNEIYGEIEFSHNQLKNLEGCPDIITGNLFLNNNELITLKGCPKIIKSGVWLNNNKLENLYYFPDSIKDKVDLRNNPELKEIQNMENFEELYLLHKKERNKKLKETLEKEITIDNQIKNDKIKL